MHGLVLQRAYVFSYPAEAQLEHFTTMLFANPAAGSVGQDLIVTNVFLPPRSDR